MTDVPVPERVWTGPDRADIFSTSEVRWFARGPVPAAVSAWFSTPGVTVEVREDEYRIDGSPDIGLKRRDHGRLELKLRSGTSGRIELGGGLSGRIERWGKITDVDERDAPGDRPGAWVEVRKAVLTRSYLLDGNGQVEPARSPDTSVTGCDIELASVTVGEITAWTFALEAWGADEEARIGALWGAWRAFEGETPLPEELGEVLEENLGYPEWLGNAARHSQAIGRTGVPAIRRS